MSFNRFHGLGRLVAEIERRNTSAGMPVAKFALAFNRKVHGEDETTFVDCVAFDKTADFLCEHFGKGKAVIIEARLNQEKWTGKDGKNRSRLQLIVERAHFVPGGDDGGARGQNDRGRDDRRKGYREEREERGRRQGHRDAGRNFRSQYDDEEPF